MKASISLQQSGTARHGRRAASIFAALFIVTCTFVFGRMVEQNIVRTDRLQPSEYDTRMFFELNKRNVGFLSEQFGNQLIQGTQTSVGSVLRHARGDMTVYLLDDQITAVSWTPSRLGRSRIITEQPSKQERIFFSIRQASMIVEGQLVRLRIRRNAVQLKGIGTNVRKRTTYSINEPTTLLDYPFEVIIAGHVLSVNFWASNDDQIEAEIQGQFEDSELIDIGNSLLSNDDLSRLTLTYSDESKSQELRSEQKTDINIERIQESKQLIRITKGSDTVILISSDESVELRKNITDTDSPNISQNMHCSNNPHSWIDPANEHIAYSIGSATFMEPFTFSILEMRGKDIFLCKTVDN